MIKILVVEDERDKLRAVMSGLLSVPGITDENIDKARDASEAKHWLKSEKYDLMILDISIPETSDLDPRPNGGLLLLDEILERDMYNKPREVVGLTAFSEAQDASVSRFSSELWTVLHYTTSADEWLVQLKRKVMHIIRNNQSSNEQHLHSADICILTALYKPELTAVLRLPWEWEDYIVEGDPTQYHRGYVMTRDGRLSVVAAHSSRMGMPAAAVLSMKMVSTFRPRYLVMAGITAGIVGRVEPGDIIAADPSWDYGSGKKTKSDTGPFFQPSPHQLSLDPFIKSKLQRLSHDNAALNAIRLEWPVHTPPLLSLHIGPLASGSSVLEDPEITTGIQGQHRKVLGIEMEAYSVFAAAIDSPDPQPSVLVMKSVCDFADSHKSDDYQDYASYTSAKAVQCFFEKYL
ncbi:response regulator [Pseudomonas alliivorans]|nr:response regulator [Pseudomonas alliivorans]MEE4973542.1 response regulator [Pseudomonas alliivorans]MEE4977872.1 response regulator [Pseudomonas alliivorans]MEE4982508.1 response regulator [Pseudomonas alliivorans]MEE5005068.1 response regulator [Pseudomonas alliivorans]